MHIDRLDHLVLMVTDIAATCTFYTRMLGMQEVTFSRGRKGLVFGDQKINLHQVGHEFEPKALRPTPGSADLCFLTSVPLAEVIAHLRGQGVEILAGPVARSGAVALLTSIYIRQLRETTFQDPRSYFYRYANLSIAEATRVAKRIWNEINAVNLKENIAPTRERARLILEKAANHAIERVRLRKL